MEDPKYQVHFIGVACMLVGPWAAGIAKSWHRLPWMEPQLPNKKGALPEAALFWEYI